MALLKESFGIYFCGIKYIYFLKEMCCVYTSIICIWHTGLQGTFSRNYPEMGEDPALLPSVCTKKENPAVLKLRE